jgi:phosphoglycolate phosphatase
MLFNNIIFDMDGTLVDSFKDICFALTAAAHHLGLPPPSKQLMRDNMHLRLDELVQTFYPDTDGTMIMQEFKIHYDGSGYPHTWPYPGVVETLQSLRQQGCRLFVATNKRKVAAEAILSRFDKVGIIEDMKTSDGSYPPLNKNEIVQRIIFEKNLDPKRTALVGDASGDWEAARHNGIFFIFASYGYGKLDYRFSNQSKILIIDSFSQLTCLNVQELGW